MVKGDIMTTQEEKTEKLAESMAANQSKSALIEKLVFAGLPILTSAVAYLMTELNTTSSELTTLKAKIAIVVNQDNKAIPPQGTTIDMAQIREALNEKIDRVEKDAALARANMTLEREKQLAALEKQRMEMTADAAQARASIRADAAMATQQLKETLGDKIDNSNTTSALARAELDKRISLIEFALKSVMK
jgi:hypothetical protein